MTSSFLTFSNRNKTRYYLLQTEEFQRAPELKAIWPSIHNSVHHLDHMITQMPELLSDQRLRQNVRDHVSRGAMLDDQLAPLHQISREMMTNTEMTRPELRRRPAPQNIHDRGVILVDHRRLTRVSLIFQPILSPYSPPTLVCEAHDLCLCRRLRVQVLF